MADQQAFGQKLKAAMLELDISQAEVSRRTGIGKSAISQYLSGTYTPTKQRQEEMALALGLENDYFERDDEPVFVLPEGIVPRIRVEDAARMLGMNHVTIKKGLQQGVFSWGYAIRTSEHRWRYFINARKFAEEERIPIMERQYVNSGTELTLMGGKEGCT